MKFGSAVFPDVSYAVGQLGGFGAMLSCTFDLRQRLPQILHLFRENAADLFPRRIMRTTFGAADDDPIDITNESRKHRKMRRNPRHLTLPKIDLDLLDLEDFPDQLGALASDITAFFDCLSEYPEFMDVASNTLLTAFQGDLKYWASCLREHRGQFRYPSVQRYLHDLMDEIGEYINDFSLILPVFVERGVPAIQFSQQHSATSLFNLSTVATFFSAVTATILQFSYELRGTGATAVNCFWFSSLVFSIAAAVNSLLGLTWKQAQYRSPGHKVPWWVRVWIRRSPLLFLVMSVASFSVGLCCFVYASHQDFITSAIITVFSALTLLGLLSVSAWIAAERWVFSRHSGKKWLSDILREATRHFLALLGMHTKPIGTRTKHAFRRWKRALRRLTSRGLTSVPRVVSIDENNSDLEANVNVNILPTSSPPASPMMMQSLLDPLPNDIRASVSSPAASPTLERGSDPTPSAMEATELSVGRQLWQNAIRIVRMRAAVVSSIATTVAENQSSTSPHLPDRQQGRTIRNAPLALRSRIAMLTAQLKCLETTQDITVHQALVRHMQFSPNGKYLATSSWDRTSLIFRVGDPVVPYRILAHAKGFVRQIAWSPTGHLLLTKLNKSVKVWTEDGVCQRTIDRHTTIESITWLPDGDGFLSVEDTKVTKLDLKGKEIGVYDFHPVKLHDVAVTPDGHRLLGVGPLLESKDKLRPSKPRSIEKRLAVFNILTNSLEHQTPMLNNVQNILLARNTKNGLTALVSYENRAPQLWKIEIVKDRLKPEEGDSHVARYTLRHTYIPKALASELAGPSHFGGKNDELVLCAGKAGDIHIWDTESGALLHYVGVQSLRRDLTCIAWNPAAEDPYMFASGSHDGTVHTIWTQPRDNPDILGENPSGSVDHGG